MNIVNSGFPLLLILHMVYSVVFAKLVMPIVTIHAPWRMQSIDLNSGAGGSDLSQSRLGTCDAGGKMRWLTWNDRFEKQY